jgi:signal transduction histidine kinase
LQNTVLSQADTRERSQLFQRQIENEKALNLARERLRFLIALGIILLISLVLLFINGARARRQNQRLLEINQAFQELQAELLRQQRELEAKQVEIEEKNNHLQELNHEKDEIMGLVAHDLKSPLANINGLIQLIQSGILNEKERSDYLTTIKDITNDGIHLINDLLTINRIESKTYQKQAKDFSFPELLDAVIKTFEPQATAKAITLLREDHFKGKGIIHSDPLTTRRILDNLLSNAIKFSPSSTVVTITSEEFPFHMKIQITDEGPGISEEEQKLLFKKFSRTGAQPTGGEPSSGLGLYIAKILTEELHGDLTVHSSKGAGATFTLNFPK